MPSHTRMGMPGECDDKEVGMLPLLLIVLLVAWVMTAIDVLRRRGFSAGRRAAWLLAALVLPLPAIPVYWLIRPLPKKVRRAGPEAAPAPQSLADLIPEWTPDVPDAWERATAWACDDSHPTPEPSFYAWLGQSGLATGHPDAAARLVRALLDNEGSRSFAACPEVGALAALFEECTVADGDLIAIRQQLRRLCPGAPAELKD